MTPASAWSSALSVRRTVVLPEPDGPMTAVTVPAAHVERDAPQDVVVAERLADVLDGEQIGHRRTYLPSRVSSLPWKNERITQITQ